jgi:hypothetical protein
VNGVYPDHRVDELPHDQHLPIRVLVAVVPATFVCKSSQSSLYRQAGNRGRWNCNNGARDAVDFIHRIVWVLPDPLTKVIIDFAIGGANLIVVVTGMRLAPLGEQSCVGLIHGNEPLTRGLIALDQQIELTPQL